MTRPVCLSVPVVQHFRLYDSVSRITVPVVHLSAGCDRGLGQQLAVHLDSLGMRVFAGCLFPGGEGETTLKSKCSERLCAVPLDVSDPEKVKAAAEIVKNQLQGKGRPTDQP